MSTLQVISRITVKNLRAGGSWIAMRQSVVLLLFIAVAFFSYVFPVASARQAPEPTVLASFVGCKSGTNAGPPREVPTSAAIEVRLDRRIAERVVLYRAQDGPAVVGPGGWNCYGSIGSSSASLDVTPPASQFPGPSAYGIHTSHWFGDTSGRLMVAQAIARVFPAVRPIYENSIRDAQQYGSVPSGAFPGDQLKYRTDRIVEFETPANSEGLGTLCGSSRGPRPIRGVAILKGRGDSLPDLDCLSFRLPDSVADLSEVIVSEFEHIHAGI